MSKFAMVLSRFSNVLAMLALVYMFGHIMLEIVLRNIFTTSTFVLDEFVGYAVSIMTFTALGETLRRGEHIRVTLLTGKVPSVFRSGLFAFGYASCVTISGLALWFVGQSVLRNYTRGTTSASIAAVPQWFPQSFVFLGLFVFTLQALSFLIGTLKGQNDLEEGEAV